MSPQTLARPCTTALDVGPGQPAGLGRDSGLANPERGKGWSWLAGRWGPTGQSGTPSAQAGRLRRLATELGLGADSGPLPEASRSQLGLHQTVESDAGLPPNRLVALCLCPGFQTLGL